MTEVIKNKYDLEERTFKFAEDVIGICKTVKKDIVSTPVISQLIRSATSIGANYMEANGASSKKDFANKIFICKKEAQETKYWLRILAVCFDLDFNNLMQQSTTSNLTHYESAKI